MQEENTSLGRPPGWRVPINVVVQQVGAETAPKRELSTAFQKQLIRQAAQRSNQSPGLFKP